MGFHVVKGYYRKPQTTIGHRVRMTAQPDVACSENIAYATVEQDNKTIYENTATNHTGLYDEVQ